ncbi:hypothetical protein IAR55_001248 [Kwoniella newhampshirensis]|uniref:Uncharacterized protein n=1 Tax=Kwoniella newhampshirensis TaxID=1651941 RepID=A0AAW0Z568_9TREE
MTPVPSSARPARKKQQKRKRPRAPEAPVDRAEVTLAVQTCDLGRIAGEERIKTEGGLRSAYLDVHSMKHDAPSPPPTIFGTVHIPLQPNPFRAGLIDQCYILLSDFFPPPPLNCPK